MWKVFVDFKCNMYADLTVFNPVLADLWPGAWRWCQRSYWLQALCEWPSKSEYTGLASSPTASAAEPCWLLPASVQTHTHTHTECSNLMTLEGTGVTRAVFLWNRWFRCLLTSSSQLSANDVMSSWSSCDHSMSGHDKGISQVHKSQSWCRINSRLTCSMLWMIFPVSISKTLTRDPEVQKMYFSSVLTWKTSGQENQGDLIC